METTEAQEQEELLRCKYSCAYFINAYCRIYDNASKSWIPFTLWPAQVRVLQESLEYPNLAVLKARQEGLSWLLAVAKPLWQSLFNPIREVGLFSRREDEAWALLKRIKAMHDLLPRYLQASKVVTDAQARWELSNGSTIRAFPTTAGDSYQLTDVVMDEFDLLDNQQALLDAVEPTAEHGGNITLISRSDKDKPQSSFKAKYRAARSGENEYHAIFLSWRDRPTRTQEWYDRKCRAALADTGSLDKVYEHYPETDEQALMPRSLNKFFNPEWLNDRYQERRPLPTANTKAPAINGLCVYAHPTPGRDYVIGADPAQGLAHGDNSSLDVLDLRTGEQVAHLAGKIEADIFAYNIISLSDYFNRAPALVESNNHGGTVISTMLAQDRADIVMMGKENQYGWHTHQSGMNPAKAYMYDIARTAVRDQDCIIHNPDTLDELSQVELSTLSGPQGVKDDRAMSMALTLLARTLSRYSGLMPEAGAPSQQGILRHTDNPYLTHNAPPAQSNPYLEGATTKRRTA